MEARTFISYAREDHIFAEKLANDLRAAGVNVWLDQTDIRPGDLWDRAVENALAAARAVVVVLSPDAVASRSVLDEVSYALDSSKPVLPVLYRACDIPFRLKRLQYTDLTERYAGGLARLVESVAGATRDFAADSAPNSQPTPAVQGSAPAGHYARSAWVGRVVRAATFGTAGVLYGIGVTRTLYPDRISDADSVSYSAADLATFAGICFAITGAVGSRDRPALVWTFGMAGVGALVSLLMYGPSVAGAYDAFTLAPGGALAGTVVYRVLRARKARQAQTPRHSAV